MRAALRSPVTGRGGVNLASNHTPVAEERRHGRIAVGLLVAIWLAFTFPAFTGKARFPADFAGPVPGESAGPLVNPELGDAFYVVYPWHTYLGDRLGAGDFPLWDPHRFAGTPFSADNATGTFYPPNWLYATGHVLAAFTVIALASLLGSLLLAYWFLRVVRLHPYAAALGAVVWTFSAFLMKWSTNEPVFASSMWLPLALGGLEVARLGRPRRGIILASVGLALSLLGGHAQMALIAWMAVALWAFVGIVSTAAGRRRSSNHAGRDVRRQVTSVLASFMLALGIAAIQLLPTAQFAGLILRQQTTFEYARLTALPTEHATTLLLPDYLGSPLDANYAGPGVNYTETAIYAGILTLPLAALGLVNRPGRLAAFFLLITIVGLLATFGTPFYRLVLALPGFSRTLFVTRFILLVDVGLAGLAALGLHSLLTEPRRRSVCLLLLALAAVAAVLVVLTVRHEGTSLPLSYIRPRAMRAVALVALAGVIIGWVAVQPSKTVVVAVALVTIVAVDLWRFGFPYNPYLEPRPIYPRSPLVESLAAVPGVRPRFANMTTESVAFNGALAHGLYGIEGYDPYLPARIVELVALAEDQRTKALGNFFGPFTASAFKSPVMDLLGVRTVVGRPGEPLGRTPTMVGGFALYDRPTAFPPAFLTSCWEIASEAEGIARLGAMSSPDLRSTAIVAEGPAARRALRTAPTGPCRSAGDVVVTRYEPERVVLSAEVEHQSVLVLTDSWYPGWRARVDGKPASLLRVDHALRGVALPPGTHRVEFEFRPAVLPAGAGVTALTMLLLFAWSAAAYRGRGAARSSTPSMPSTESA